MRGRQLIELGNEAGIVAEQQVGLDAVGRRGQAQILEPVGRGRREALAACELAERRAAPHGERTAKRLRGTLGVPGAQGRRPCPRVRLESQRVDVARARPRVDSRRRRTARRPRPSARRSRETNACSA